MSWGAFNICSEDHATVCNVEVAAGAKYAVRYPHEFDAKGIRFWATPMGAALDIGRCGRSWDVTSWLYERDQSPTPTVTYEKGTSLPTPPDPSIHLATINGYDVSKDGGYSARFNQQCNRLVVIQNAQYYYDSGFVLDISNASAKYYYPKKVSSAELGRYDFRPYVSPSMPDDPSYENDKWPNLETKRGMQAWVNNGWAYKKPTETLNDYSQWEFDWEQWENDSIWDTTPNPTAGLNKNMLYLVTKTYSHGPDCDGTHIGYPSPRYCNDRKLTGYTPYYWYASASPPPHWNKDSYVKSLCVSDGYPYILTGYYGYKHSWAPYSITCGADGTFTRTRNLESHTPISGHGYAKTDQYQTVISSTRTVAGTEALREIIPPNTAFDLIVYLEVINCAIFTRQPPGEPQNPELVETLYWNTKCYSILHQIAPLPAKPL